MMHWLKRTLIVDSRVLLGFYAIIPILLIVALLDMSFFDYRIRASFPDRPETYLWWTIIFNLPHIMASLVTYADKEYLVAYKKSLLTGLGVSVLAIAGIPLVFGLPGLFIFGAWYTMYHVLMQQYGIALMLLKRRPNKVFHVWKWLSIAGTSFFYMQVYFPNLRDIVPGMSLASIGTVLLLVSAPFGLIFYAGIARAPDITRTSKLYFLGTYLMLFFACGFYYWGYLFFLFLIPRFVHDATAFTVYAVHDHNRNLTTYHNVIYRLLKPLHLSPAILCLPLGIGIAWLLTMNQPYYMSAGIAITIFSFLHYYMEGYMWRRGMPHRNNMGFHIA